MPKRFWPEAVIWATYVMNRSPTHAVKDITPEEAWNGMKPSVHYFIVFGCVAHAHIPDAQRKKLDDKSIRCVLLGVSEESKAYKLYNPIEKKIIVSRDVVFEEDKGWNWHGKEAVKQIDDISVNNEVGEIEIENPNADIGNEAGIENEIVNDTEDEDSAHSNNNEGSDYDSEGSNDLPLDQEILQVN
jgi:hypothetical protein